MALGHTCDHPKCKRMSAGDYARICRGKKRLFLTDGEASRKAPLEAAFCFFEIREKAIASHSVAPLITARQWEIK